MNFKPIFSLAKEPIVQFVVLGALLFGLDHLLLVNRDDPRNVMIDDRQINEFIEIFEEGQGRPPSGREINNMIIAWSQNEILYREARSMGLDRGDDMIRNRLLLKIRNVMFNNVVIDQPGEEELQQFFEFNKAAYRIPARFDLEMIVLPAEFDLADARQLHEQSAHTEASDTWPGTRFRYQNRDQSNLVSMFGQQDAADLMSVASDDKRWSLISNPQGHHLVRITAMREAVAPSFDSVRSRVIQDWERYAGDVQIADQTYSIAQHYRVHLDLSDAYLEKLEDDLPRNPFDGGPAQSGQLFDEQGVRSELVVDGR